MQLAANNSINLRAIYRMKSIKNYFLSVSLLAFSSLTLAQQTIEIGLHDFMEEYVKPAAELAKEGNDAAVLRVLEVIPHLALEKDRDAWQKIVSAAIDAKKPNSSCRACHKEYKRDYDKNRPNMQILIPEELIKYLETTQL